MDKKTIVFDFDGVIHKYSKGWQDGSIYDGYNQEIIDIMEKLAKEGYPIAIVSTRNPIQISQWWNNKNFNIKATPKINGEKFWNDSNYIGVFNYKIPAAVYIDDRAICFNGESRNLLDKIINFKTYQEEKEKSNLEKHAERELNMLLDKCEDDQEGKEMQKLINADMMEMVELFANQGHSGFSASYAINMLNKLLNYEPILPLTGEDNEWEKLNYSKDTCYQNKRCPRVFKNEDGQAYDIEGKVFSDNGGKTWYQSRDSRVYIEFPYRPHTEKIILDNKEE